MKTERKTDFDKISVKAILGEKVDATFSIKGGTYKFSSKGLTDKEHESLSKAFNQFVENKDIRLPPSIKFNMIENCIHGFDDLSTLVRGFTADSISIAGQYFPAPETRKIIKKVHESRAKKLSPTGRLTNSSPEMQNIRPKLSEKDQKTVDAIKEAMRASAQSKAASPYVYPDGMPPEEKKRFRAKARAEARKQAAG